MAEQVYLARLKPAVMNGLPRSIGFLGKAGADSIMARGIHNASLTGRIHSRRPILLPTQNFCLQKCDGPYIHNPKSTGADELGGPGSAVIVFHPTGEVGVPSENGQRRTLRTSVPAIAPRFLGVAAKPTPWEFAVGLQVRLSDPSKPFRWEGLLENERLREPQELRSRRATSECAKFSKLVLNCSFVGTSQGHEFRESRRRSAIAVPAETLTYAIVRFLTGPHLG